MTNKSLFSTFASSLEAVSLCHLRLLLHTPSDGHKGTYALFQRLFTTCFKRLKRVVRRHCTTCAEALRHQYIGTVTPVHRHCGTRTSALRHTYIGIAAHVHRHCGTRTLALRHTYIGIVHPVRRHLFVICHTFVATRKRLYIKAFSALVTNKQIKMKNCM